MTLHQKFHLLPLLIAMGLFFYIPSLAEIASGTWGTGANPAIWTLEDDGVLTVTGGKGASQNGKSESPWIGNASEITSIDFYGVTFPDNCQNLFRDLSLVQSIHINDGCIITDISSVRGMFSGCSELTSIVGLSAFGSSLSSDFTEMFFNCKSLLSVDFSPFLTTE